MEERERFAEIVVDIAHSNIDKIFDYRIPSGIVCEPGSRVLVPFGSAVIEGIVLQKKTDTDYPIHKIKDILRTVDEFPVVTEEQIQLAKLMCAQYHTTLTFALRLMFPSKMRKERIKKKQQRMIRIRNAEKIEELKTACYTKHGIVRAKNRLRTILQLEKEPTASVLLDAPSVRYLIDAGAAEEYFEDSYRRPSTVRLQSISQSPRQLTMGQTNAIGALCQSVAAGKKETFLLRGVTGSGKTLVYLETVRFALSLGKTAMVLVPEIALAPQLYSVFYEEFGDRIALFHSGLSDGEKYDEWRRIRAGEATIVIGARSAVFMPVQNLGVIIIDEQHEESYRAENHPPYHAAEIAKLRCHLSNATLLLSSATPLVEDYMKAKLGIYRLLLMEERVRGLSLPNVTVVDMRREFVKGNRSLISVPLKAALKEILSRKEQALLFLNRRGYAGSVLCPSCGAVRKCPHCDVPLKLHRSKNGLVCHYCGRVFPYNPVCPVCGEPSAKLISAGTEQLEKQLEEQFPNARVLRMDFDTTREKNAHEKIYTAFQNHEADILIGTQMIARGLDFANVTLSAIISADSMLLSGDDFAGERAFAMMEQVAGRAGRTKAGQVIIQAYQTEHYAVKCAASHDYEALYAAEISFRQKTGKPPFALVYALTFQGAQQKRTKNVLEATDRQLQTNLLPYQDQILSYSAKPAPIEKLNDQFRYQILVRFFHSRKSKEIQRILYRAWDDHRTSGVTSGITRNPYNLS